MRCSKQFRSFELVGFCLLLLTTATTQQVAAAVAIGDSADDCAKKQYSHRWNFLGELMQGTGGAPVALHFIQAHLEGERAIWYRMNTRVEPSLSVTWEGDQATISGLGGGAWMVQPAWFDVGLSPVHESASGK